MLSLVLCAVVAQGPSLRVAVVRGSNLGFDADLVQSVEQLATLDGLEVVAGLEACADQQCLLDTAAALKAAAVISGSLAALGRDTVMDLECLQLPDGASIAQTMFTVRAATPAGIRRSGARSLPTVRPLARRAAAATAPTARRPVTERRKSTSTARTRGRPMRGGRRRARGKTAGRSMTASATAVPTRGESDGERLG